MTPLVIGVTSHRDLPPEDTEAIRLRVRALLEQLQQAFPRLPLVVLSALAEGGDRLVAAPSPRPRVTIPCARARPRLTDSWD